MWQVQPYTHSNRTSDGAPTGGRNQVGASIWHMPIDRLLFAAVCAFPLWLIFSWVTGLTFFAILLVVAVSLFVPGGLSRIEKAVFASAFFLLVGLMVGLVTGMVGDRAMSSIYHIIHWGILAAFIRAGVSITRSSDRDRLLGRLSDFSLISLACMSLYMLTMAWVVSSNPVAIQFPTLIVGKFASSINMLSGYVAVSVSKVNSVLSGSEWRLIGFGLWTSEGAYLAVVIGLFAMISGFVRFGVSAIVFIEVLVLAAVVLTGSRTTLGAFVLSMGFWLLLAMPYWRALLVISTPILIAGLVFFIGYGLEMAIESVQRANEFRQDSSGARFLSYITAWNMAIDLNPLTGLGATPLKPELLHIPIGSHSSWTSVLIRGGFLGVMAFAWIHLLLIGRAAKSIRFLVISISDIDPKVLVISIVLMRALLVTLLSWITEDLDGPAAGAAFAGLVLGLFWGWNDRIQQIGKPKPEGMQWR